MSKNEFSIHDIEAFDFSIQAEMALNQRHLKNATTFVFKSLQLDPQCIDAWRVLSVLTKYDGDSDTMLNTQREILSYARLKYSAFFSKNGKFYEITQTRSYIRLLFEIFQSAFRGDQTDTATFALEEVLRLNHKDNTASRDPLLCMYLMLIGRSRRQHPSLPERKMEQAEALFKTRLSSSGSPAYANESQDVIVRWTKIIFHLRVGEIGEYLLKQSMLRVIGCFGWFFVKYRQFQQ